MECFIRMFLEETAVELVFVDKVNHCKFKILKLTYFNPPPKKKSYIYSYKLSAVEYYMSAVEYYAHIHFILKTRFLLTYQAFYK